MVNKEKALERELIRLRKNQNPQQLDFRRMNKIRKVRTELWKLRRKRIGIASEEAPKKKDQKEKKEPKKEKKKEEPVEDDEFDDDIDLEDLYDDDFLDDENLEDDDSEE